MREIILIVSSFALYFVVILFITMWYKETQLKKRQEDVTASLREMAEMEKHANEAKTQFLSSMSHDIRTPMNAIIGTVTVASKYTHDPERIKKYLGQIEVAGNHLLTMINDILDLSKIESGQIVLSRIRFSIEEMMNDLVSLVRVQMREKGQTLDWTITNLEYPWLWGDVHRLNQIYLNLLSNAVKYTQDHGHIVMDLRQELIERKTETTNGKDKKEKYVRLTFYIQDNGIGMSKEFMGQMYDSFVRNTNSTINPVAGSGLGLCLVKQMVEIMDGTITCESEPEVGTTFVVQLDLEVAEEPMSSMQPLKKQAKENELDLSKTRILVAEDNDINWEILNEMLSMYGIQAIRAENGQVCVALFQKSPEKYDLILMDVQMPVMDGREASRKIREIPNPYAQSIPIIATTADVFVEDILICEAAGMNGHLSKPIEMNLLIEELRKRIGKGKNVC